MHNPLGFFLVALVVFIVIAGYRQTVGHGMAGLRYPFGFFILGFFGFWFFSFFRGKSWSFEAMAPVAWLTVLMFVVTSIGFGGLLASFLSAVGPLQFSASWEWPAGYVRGVITTPNGRHVVPLWPCGRVQIYDSGWRFIRGWNVDAWGGVFEVQCSKDGTIEVLTSRGDRNYRYTEEGQLLSSERLSEPIPLWTTNGRSVMVPTRWWLWIFSSPILSGATGVISLAVLAALSH